MRTSYLLHRNYQKSVNAFLNIFPNSDSGMLALNIDGYCRAAAMLLWGNFQVDRKLCAECINEIYTKENARRVYTMEDVNDALDRIEKTHYKLTLPLFYKKIIEYDTTHKTNYSRKLAACLKLVFISFALIDGEVSFEEARLISGIVQLLLDACNRSNIAPFADTEDPYDYVTESSNKVANIRDSYHATQSTANRNSAQKEQSVQRDPMEKLNELIGLSSAKLAIQEIADFASVQNARKSKGLPTSEISYHLVFTGNPGSGKTTVARIVADIYKKLGILSKGHLVEASAKDLVAGYVGQTAIKTAELIEQAQGGILFIDEAYSLLDTNGQGYGHEAVDTLLKEMEDRRGDFAVIVAGYDDLMKQFVESNPGLKSRFTRYIHFEDYNAEEMLAIFNSLCERNAYVVEESAKEIVRAYFEQLCANHGSDFANARSVRNYFELVIAKQASRLSKQSAIGNDLSTITEEDVIWSVINQKEEKIDDILKELDELTGLETVKEEISNLVYMVQHQQKRKAQGLKVPSTSLHLVFMGNPGTGKTTVARIIARIYKALGLIPTSHLVETDRSGLVAGYVGQTAIKTKKIIDEANGGVLFIDEAYTLTSKGDNDFGQEAIDTLLKEMEDKRDCFAVIVAGYDDLMDEFIQSNPGLESRFNRYIHFADYSPEQMVEIFSALCEKNQYILNPEAADALHTFFKTIKGADIANGRGVRNLFELTVTQQAKRISVDEEGNDLSTVMPEDISDAIMKLRVRA